MNVLLHDPSTARDGIVSTALDNLLDLLEAVGDLDTMPPICILTWFDDPHVRILSDVSLVVHMKFREGRFIHSVLDVERDG